MSLEANTKQNKPQYITYCGFFMPFRGSSINLLNFVIILIVSILPYHKYIK
jgi:hypothetical protein